MRKLLVLGVALALGAGTALASPPQPQVNKATLYSSNAKGSLLILADIDISGQRDTLIRLVNDGDQQVRVKCMWVTWEKARADFEITLTPHQPVIFNAADGDGSIIVNPFPTENPAGAGGDGTSVNPASNYGIGELKCWALAPPNLREPDGLIDGQGPPPQMIYNHLSATATVIDFAAGTAYSYPAAAFYLRGNYFPVFNALEFRIPQNQLLLDGENYDKCGQYLIGQFSPVQDAEGLEMSKGTVNVLSNRLALVSCRQDLRQDWIPHITKLQFDVFNGHETKFTGAWECSDSFHVTNLGANTSLAAKPPIPLVRWAMPGNFRYSALGTKAAYFRLEGVKSTQCDKVSIWGQPTSSTYYLSEPTGLIGVLSSVFDVGGQPAAAAILLPTAGTNKGLGLIEIDPTATGTAESRR